MRTRSHSDTDTTPWLQVQGGDGTFTGRTTVATATLVIPKSVYTYVCVCI